MSHKYLHLINKQNEAPITNVHVGAVIFNLEHAGADEKQEIDN